MRHDRKKEALRRSPEMRGSHFEISDYNIDDQKFSEPKEEHHFNDQDLVLVRLKDFPDWPARVRKAEDFGLLTIPNTIFVTCFGTGEVRFCRYNEVSPITPGTKSSLECKLQQQRIQNAYRLAIKEIIDLDEGKRASDSENASKSRKKFRRLQDLLQVDADEDSTSDRRIRCLENLAMQAREVSSLKGQKTRRLHDILNSEKIKGSLKPDLDSNTKSQKQLNKKSHHQCKVAAMMTRNSRLRLKNHYLQFETGHESKFYDRLMDKCDRLFEQKSIRELCSDINVEETESVPRVSNLKEQDFREEDIAIAANALCSLSESIQKRGQISAQALHRD